MIDGARIASDYHGSFVVIYNRKKYSRGAFYILLQSRSHFTLALLYWLLSWVIWVGRRNLFCYTPNFFPISSFCVKKGGGISRV
jgi:hypothetical protein